MTRETSDSFQQPKILLVGIHAPYNRTDNIESYFDEFVNLVESNNVQYDAATYIKLRTIDPGTFISKGKLQHILNLCDEHDIDEVIISEPLTPRQERNLCDYLHRNVFDRTQLILEIFEKNAHTAEGKTQVQIAMLEYLKTRLAGKGIGMAQQRGIAGLRGGFGETAKEKERRHIEESILKLKKQLKKIHITRETQRKRRLTTRVPLICLIGYTNAGKSTILNNLTKSDVLAENRLFATLDTTTRELFIEGQKVGVLSDTVGFIQQLPHHLIEAFKSTLSELQYANLLLHVIDIADMNWHSHTQVVETILNELDVDKPTLYVFNKADEVEMTPALAAALSKFQPHVIISANTKEGIIPLVEFLHEWCPEE